MIVGASSRTSARTSPRNPLLGRRRMARLEDAAINAAAEMFDERAEQAPVGFANDVVPV